MTGRRGFSFIELLVALIVFGILAGISLLRYKDLRNHAVSAAVASDLNGIRLAAYNHWADRESWPADAAPGVVPPELVPYLPQGFTFTRPTYTLDWEGGGGAVQAGVVVTTADPGLMVVLARRLGGNTPFFVLGATLTYVIVGPTGTS